MTDDAAWVAAHLDRLAAAGLRVPRPRGTTDGVVAQADDHEAARAVGELLARAHPVVAVTDVAARDGWSPLINYAESPRAGDWTLRSAMVRLGQPRPDRVTVVADLMRRCDLHLHPLRRDVEAHPVVAHYDVRPDNVLRTDDGVVLLDWDFAHPDHRAADVAVAMRGWPEAAEDLLAGYESVTPLTEPEHAALPLLAAARGLDHLASRIAAWADDRRAHDLDELVAEIDREVEDLTDRLAPYRDDREPPPGVRRR